MPQTDIDIDSIVWLSPSHYPSRATPEISLAMAIDIVKGASWGSAAKKYGIYDKVRKWMDWGYEAAQVDAGPEHMHAWALDFYLKVGQALGIAECRAQQTIFRDYPQWWLVRNPETSYQWASSKEVGAVAQTDSVLMPAQITSGYNESAPFVQSVTDLRETLAALYQSGAALPTPAADAQIVEADYREGTGTDGDS